MGLEFRPGKLKAFCWRQVLPHHAGTQAGARGVETHVASTTWSPRDPLGQPHRMHPRVPLRLLRTLCSYGSRGTWVGRGVFASAPSSR